MEVKAIKFYVSTPTTRKTQGEDRVTTDTRATYLALGEQTPQGTVSRLEVFTHYGTPGFLEVRMETTQGDRKLFIYQMADILGRIEITT